MTRIEAHDVVLDLDAHLVTVRGHAINLALQEFRLLELLMSRADHVVASADILRSVWGETFDGDPSTVAVHVLRLRRKLGRHGGDGHVRTVRGLGYVFDTVPTIASAPG